MRRQWRFSMSMINRGIVIMTLIVVAAGFSGCNNLGMSSGNDVVTVKIERCDENVTEKFDSLFNYHKHVILETTDESLVGRINKILFTDDAIYIMNDNSRITVFNKDGNYLRTISNVGHGPGEYTKLCDFDMADGILYYLDGRRIHKYQADGRYLESIDMENASQGLCVLPSGIALNNGFGFSSGATKENHCYSFINKDGETKSMLRYNQALTGLTYTVNSQVCKFSKRGSDVLTFFPFNDTIYMVDSTDGDLTPLVNIKIGDRNITEDTNSREIDRILRSDAPPTIASVYKLGDRILFTFVDEFPKTILVELNGNVLINGIVTIDKNGLPVSISETEANCASHEIVSIVPSSLARSLASKLENLSDYPILKDIYEKTEESSNPVLVIYKPEWTADRIHVF